VKGLPKSITDAIDEHEAAMYESGRDVNVYHEPTAAKASDTRGALEKAIEGEIASWRKGVEDANRISQRYGAGSPDDLRTAGWAVAVHNDYRLSGAPHTFWLLTKGDRCVKGEGRADAEALDEIRRAVKSAEKPPSSPGSGPQPLGSGGETRAPASLPGCGGDNLSDPDRP
jgi:hypothetical protein